MVCEPHDAAAQFDAPGGPDAALCLHGLTGSPYEVRPVAEALADAGLRVRAPRLVGHGRTPKALQHTRWDDWLAAARRHFNELAEEHERIYLVGLSMGALCAIALAHERGARVAGVVSMATPLELEWKSQATLRLARRIPLADVLPFLAKTGGPDVSDAAVAAAMPSYDQIPLAAAASMLDGQLTALDRIPRLGVPFLVQHGRYDHVAPVHNAHRLMKMLRTPHRRLVVYPRSWHVLPLDVEHEAVARDIVDFVAQTTGASQ